MSDVESYSGYWKCIIAGPKGTFIDLRNTPLVETQLNSVEEGSDFKEIEPYSELELRDCNNKVK